MILACQYILTIPDFTANLSNSLIGIYAIQLAQLVFRSEPIDIRAEGILNDNGLDIESRIQMTYASGGIARFKISLIKQLNNKAIIHGSKSSMTVSLFSLLLNLVRPGNYKH